MGSDRIARLQEEHDRWLYEAELYMRLYQEAITALTPFAKYLRHEKGIYGFREEDLAPIRGLMKRGLIYD